MHSLSFKTQNMQKKQSAKTSHPVSSYALETQMTDIEITEKHLKTCKTCPVCTEQFKLG